jgi:SAM-dependent methyltransferase
VTRSTGDEWEWDETLFSGAATYYARGRLPYAEGLGDALATALELDGTGRLLDVGCGPGSATLRFAPHLAAVVGLDPDPGMLAEAARLAAESGITNATWVQLRGEDLPAELGTFRVVTFAASLHWMDRARVFAAVRDMLDPGESSAVVHVDNRHQDLPSIGTPPEILDDFRRRYLGDDLRAGQSLRSAPRDDEDDVFRSVGFTGPELVVVPDGRTLARTIDDLVAAAFSMSFMAPHLFGDRVDEFEAEFRAALAVASPSGTFEVTLPDNQLRIWRRAS